jgi:elongation factor P
MGNWVIYLPYSLFPIPYSLFPVPCSLITGTINADYLPKFASFMISSNDFRPGVSIVLDGSVWRVIDFLHVKPGKGSAFVRTTIKNVQTGKVLERTFRAGETVPQATLEKLTMQHTYKEGEEFIFMDMETYEEGRLSAAQIGDRVKYLKEGMEVNVIRWGEQVLEVELPNSVVLEVVETDPGVKGDTATGGTKPAKVETGATVMVPLFISQGERIKIDTREDKYLGRE